MKIGFLIPYFYPTTGGAENNCYYTARELAKRHEVHVFCSGPENKQEKVSGINVHRCKEAFRIKYYFAFYPSVTRELLNQDLDVLHVHGMGFLQHDRAISQLRKKNPKIKIICTPHGPFMALKKYNLLGQIFKTLYLPFIKRNARSYDAVIAVNPSQKEWMIKDHGISKERIHFVPNGINRETFFKTEKKDFSGKFVVSYLGRIQKYKGLDQVIKALPDLKRLSKNILFVMMGEDVGDKLRLQELAETLNVRENILFTGKVSEKDKLSILDASEIFVFPSEWEAFGIVTLEAMARENAVVSSRTEGGLYLVKEKENGFLFDYGNVKELEQKIRILMEDKKLLKQIQKNNYKKSKEFLWEKIASQLEKLYKSLI